jgi:pimeloyl-ACP methyl ester carboxylesterase
MKLRSAGWLRQVSRNTSLTIPALLLSSSLVGCNAGAPGTTVTQGETLSSDGVAISYDVRGAGDPTIVLVHGWTNPRAIWGEHPNTLSRTNRVVALDLAGHGASGADRTDWTVDAFGEDVVAVVDQLELENVVLVGFSMGAGVVVEAAERLGERVVGVVFVDALHDPDREPNLAETEQMIPVMRSMWGDTAAVRAFAFTPDAPDSLVNYVLGLMGEEPPDHWFEMILPYDGWLLTEFKPALQRLKAPIAAINTARQPTNVEAWRLYSPSFTVDTMAGVGHAGILLQRVDDFDALLLAIIDRFERGESVIQTE